MDKSRLEAPAGGGVHPFANDAEGIAEMLEWLAEWGAGLVVCEPADGYQEPLVRSLRQAGGRWAKTGRLDAQALSSYGQVFASQEDSQPEPEREEVQALLRRRQLVDQRVQELNRLDRARNPAVHASAQRHIDWLD